MRKLHRQPELARKHTPTLRLRVVSTGEAQAMPRHLTLTPRAERNPESTSPQPPFIRIMLETARGRAEYLVIAPDGSQVARLEVEADLWRDPFMLPLWEILQDATERHERSAATVVIRLAGPNDVA